MNLAVNQCLRLSEVSPIVGKYCKIVAFFKQSGQKLQAAEKELKLDKIHNQQDVEARRNSAMQMKQRILQAYPAIRIQSKSFATLWQWHTQNGRTWDATAAIWGSNFDYLFTGNTYIRYNFANARANGSSDAYPWGWKHSRKKIEGGNQWWPEQAMIGQVTDAPKMLILDTWFEALAWVHEVQRADTLEELLARPGTNYSQN